MESNTCIAKHNALALNFLILFLIFMNKRFVWNFEINTNNTLEIPVVENFVQSPNHWESRFFWPQDQIVTLNGLNDDFLHLSHYQIKHRHDTYYLLPNADYNLKTRHDQLFYKPILMKKPQAIAYAKKIKLDDEADLQFAGYEDKGITALINHIKSHGQKITVEKEALIYRFDTIPTIKLELAWLNVANKSYLSASIESRSFSLVESITRQLLGDLPTSDYVSFLGKLRDE